MLCTCCLLDYVREVKQQNSLYMYRHFSYRWPWSFLKRQSRGTDDYNSYRLLRNTEVCMLNNICLVMNKVLTIRDVCHSMDVETVDKIKAICLLELFTHILFLNF